MLVLKESIKQGKEVEFIYKDIYEKHKDVLFISKLDTTMKFKMDLFNNLDESSYTFSKILDTAKMACIKLQRGEGYNYYSAELILRFNQLEDCFKKKLKPIGVRIIEQKEKITILDEQTIYFDKEKSNEKNIIEIDENDIYLENVVPLTKGAKYVRSNVSGKKFLSKIKQEKDISSAIKESQFKD